MATFHSHLECGFYFDITLGDMQYTPSADLLVSMVHPAVDLRGVCLRNCNVMMSVSAERF